MKAKVGLYHFCLKRNLWSVYQYTSVSQTSNSSSHIEDYCNYEDAVKAVYRLNGWAEPRNIVKRF
ncbi:hypothetical protein D0T56_10080 [Dysgonomonas sp. 520]|nr:hypothetical protein [Dysgonomonas sp. 520]